MTEENPQSTRKKPAPRQPRQTGTRKKPASSRERSAAIKADAATIRQALDDLAINRPYYSARVVGNRLELRLYGGDVVTWPEVSPEASKDTSKPKADTSKPKSRTSAKSRTPSRQTGRS